MSDAMRTRPGVWLPRDYGYPPNDHGSVHMESETQLGVVSPALCAFYRPYKVMGELLQAADGDVELAQVWISSESL